MSKVRKFTKDSIPFRLEALRFTKSQGEWEFWTDFEAALRRRMDEHYGESESRAAVRDRGQVGEPRIVGPVEGPGPSYPGSLGVGFDTDWGAPEPGPLPTRSGAPLVGRGLELPACCLCDSTRSAQEAQRTMIRLLEDVQHVMYLLLTKSNERSYGV